MALITFVGHITFWTNVTAKGRTIHLGERMEGFTRRASPEPILVALCGYESNMASIIVGQAATCKRCLKIAARRGQKT